MEIKPKIFSSLTEMDQANLFAAAGFFAGSGWSASSHLLLGLLESHNKTDDTKRLEQLVKAGVSVQSHDGEFYLMDHHSCIVGNDKDSNGQPFTDWRRLIDANMNELEWNRGKYPHVNPIEGPDMQEVTAYKAETGEIFSTAEAANIFLAQAQIQMHTVHLTLQLVKCKV